MTIDFLTIIPRVRMGSESIVGQKYRGKTTLAGKTPLFWF